MNIPKLKFRLQEIKAEEPQNLTDRKKEPPTFHKLAVAPSRGDSSFNRDSANISSMHDPHIQEPRRLSSFKRKLLKAQKFNFKSRTSNVSLVSAGTAKDNIQS